MLRKTLRLRLLLLLPLLSAAAAFAAEPTPQEAPQVVYLWPAGHPTLQGANEKEITNPPQSQPGQVIRQFKNIHNPSLEVFLPPKEKATGAVLIVAAGGGHRELNTGAEGYDLREWLHGLGVAVFIAKGLKPISGHFPFERFRDNVEEIARDAKALGLEYAGCAWIPHQIFDEKTAREAIAVFNRAGEALSRHGLKFFYHTHGYEFQSHGSGTLFDLMMAETKPEFVSYEMDVFWIVHPGQDPVKLLEKYGSRFELMHVKDMKKGAQTGLLTGKSDVKNDVTLGTGMMDWPAILKAAQKAGVKWYFIEDESPASAQQIPLSLRYLERVKF